MSKETAARMRVMRMMKLCFIVYGLMLIYLVVRIPARPHLPPSPAFGLAITAVALAAIVAGFLAPLLFGRAGSGPPQAQPGSTPLGQWMKVNIFSLACFNACMLFGFVLHSLGARVLLVEIALAAGMISLLIWSRNLRPRPATTIHRKTEANAP